MIILFTLIELIEAVQTEPIVTSYPLYEANQLLDEGTLNLGLNYLKQQIRLSRVGMGTVGRIIGHEFAVGTDSSNHKTITITSGFSVSIEGNILLLLNDYDGINSRVFSGQQPNDLPKVYKYYVSYQKKNGTPGITGDEFFRLIAPPFSANQDMTLNPVFEALIENTFTDIEDSLQLLTDEEASNWVDTTNPPILLGSIADLNTKMLTLYYETSSIENSNCNQNSCNDDGQIINIRTVALLVPKSDLLFPPVNYLPIEYDILHLQKFKALSDRTNSDANIGNYRITFNTVAKQNLRDIKAKLSQLRSDFENFPITEFNSEADIFDDASLDMIINQIPDSGSTTIFHDQYHFSNTVRQAINEFITFHNQVFIDNVYEGNSFLTERRQRFVVLGLFNTLPDKMDNYTYYPVSIDRMINAQNQFILLKKLYDRIWMLIFSFGRYKGLFNGSPYTGSAFAAQLPIAVQTQTTFPKVTASRYLPAPLGDQAIPSFFSFTQTGEDVQFLNYWKGKLLNQEKNTNGVFSTYDGGFPAGTNRLTNSGISLNVDSSEYGFYRIEGHIGHRCGQYCSTCNQL